MYEYKGTVKVVYDEQTFASGFSKREFVVTSEGERFPQDVKFEAVKEKADALKTVKAGDKVTVSFDLRGNEYNGKYYVNLNAWKIVKHGGGSGNAAAASDGPPLDHYDDNAEAEIDEPPF